MMNEKRNGKNFLRSLLCLVVMLAMLLSMVACGADPVNTSAPTSVPTQGTTQPSTTAQPTQPTTAPTTPPTTAPTTVPTTAPTEPTQPTEPVQTVEPIVPEPGANTLEYTLTQADVDEFYRLLSECESLSLVGEDLEAIDAATVALDESYEHMNAQCSIAAILHYSHTGNEELEQQYLDCVEICTDANDAYLQMARRVYQSDTPAKDQLFEGWTEKDIAHLMAYTEQVAQLQQRNAEIEVEYEATGSDSKKIELYLELVQNNNQIAQIYGYDNYYTYAYAEVYDRDYDPEQLELMRQYVKEYLAPAFGMAYMKFYRSFYMDAKPADQLAIQSFLFEDYNAIGKSYVESYLQIAPENLRDAITDMIRHNSVFTNAGDAMEGAFTTTIGDRSYCYFGPGYASCSTVIHEGGHYYASLYTDLGSIPLDLAETHSQGNEWLFMTYLKDVMPEKHYKAVRDYTIYNNLWIILVSLMVDEFEQQVYTSDVSTLNARKLDGMMDKIALQYFPAGNVEDSLTDMNYYWRQVVVSQPVYYISYGVSAVAAMGLYPVALEDFDAAMAIYQKLCEEPLEGASFLDNLQSVGLPGPFDESFYKDLMKIINGV